MPIESDIEDNYLGNRPFLTVLLPCKYRRLVECDSDLLTVLQTNDFYTNFRYAWGIIMACLFKWGGEKYGRFGHELTIEPELANYVASHHDELDRYMKYASCNFEEELRRRH